MPATEFVGTPKSAVPSDAEFVHFTEIPRKVQNVLNDRDAKVNGWSGASVAHDESAGTFYVVLLGDSIKHSSRELLSRLRDLPYEVSLEAVEGYYVYTVEY